MFEFGTQSPLHDPYGLYRRVIQDLAIELCERLTKRLIRRCQAQTFSLADRTILINLWEEICVSLRQDSILSSSYEDYLEGNMVALIDALAPIERQILWLATDHGIAYATYGPSAIFPSP